MDERDNRSALEQLLLAFVGAVALTGERADRLAEELAEAGGIRRDEARAKIEELAGRWRGDAVRVRERAGESIEKVAHDLGLVSRREFDELELRLAQLEHRLRLLEDRPDAV
jgi:polyhydroxyalkanoate synthesis regulator phasin